MKDTPELRAAIRATSAFRDLSDDNLTILIEAAELETFDPDATLMVQGEPSDFAMLILEGSVTVSADSARGRHSRFHASRPRFGWRNGSAGAIAAQRLRTRLHPRHGASLWPRRACRSRSRNAVPAHRRHRPDGRSHAQVQWRDQPLHARAWRRSNGMNSIPRCSRNCAIRSLTSPISGRLSGGWPSRSSCAVSVTTKWPAPRSFSARFCPG